MEYRLSRLTQKQTYSRSIEVDAESFQGINWKRMNHQSTLHKLIERITAYPDRKMEVKFRISEIEEKNAGGEVDDPTSQHTPYTSYLLRGYQ